MNTEKYPQLSFQQLKRHSAFVNSENSASMDMKQESIDTGSLTISEKERKRRLRILIMIQILGAIFLGFLIHSILTEESVDWIQNIAEQQQQKNIEEKEKELDSERNQPKSSH